MKDKRILYISSEVVPYLPETEISSMSFEAPRMVNKQGGQIRIFMPRFGNINERRHQLHEVIRLSGINLVINDLDMPLIIKVASIPKERIQVYFIDNEDYFKRKATLTDEEGKLLEFASACGPLIYRGDILPESYNGNAFVCEPTANLIKRNKITEEGFMLSAQGVYKDREFLASIDERFRPIIRMTTLHRLHQNCR